MIIKCIYILDLHLFINIYIYIEYLSHDKNFYLIYF